MNGPVRCAGGSFRLAAASVERVAHVRSLRVEVVLAYLRRTQARAVEHGVQPSDRDLQLPLGRTLPRWQAVGGSLVSQGHPPAPWDVYAESTDRRLVLLGLPGAGKTRILHYEASRLAAAASRLLLEQRASVDWLVVPVLVDLRELSSSDDDVGEALVRHATDSLFPETDRAGLEALRLVLGDKLYSGACVVLLDSWDRVPMETPRPGAPIRYEPHRRQRLGQRLGEFMQQFPDAKVILTSRIAGYAGVPFEVTHVELT